MGCPESKDKATEGHAIAINEPPPKQVDPRLPFDTYRQVFNMKNAWKCVSRTLETSAKECLVQWVSDYHDN